MFSAFQPEAPASAACLAVEALARERFVLDADSHVVVVEQATTLPGCPPFETMIDFWADTPEGATQRHHCKIFKSAVEVGPDDLPPTWMKSALAVNPTLGCACC